MLSAKSLSRPDTGLSSILGVLAVLLAAAPAVFAVPPNAPSNPNVTNLTATSATLRWTDNAGNEQGFSLYAGFGDTAPSTATYSVPIPNLTQLPIPAGTLTPNSQFTFQVSAYNADGESAKTAPLTFWTLAVVPPVPVVAPLSPTALLVTVVPAATNPDFTQYALRCTSANQWVQLDGTLGANAAWQTAEAWGTVTVTGLTTGTTYTFATRARNGGNVETANSATASGTPSPPPAAPSNLNVTDVGVYSVGIAWTDNSATETGFNLYAGLGPEPPSAKVGDFPANTTSHTLPLGANVYLSLQIAAFNAYGESDWSNTVTFCTFAETPSAPVVGGASNNSLNVAVGSRGANPDETEYAIQCVTTGEWVQADGALGASPAWRTAPDWDTITVTGLDELTEYGFAVVARNVLGTETDPGPAASATTKDLTPPTGSIVINNNQSATNSPNVTLGLAWSDGSGSGVVRMRFSDDGKTWSAWEPLKAVKPHILPGPDGHKTVRVQFRDLANNVSEAYNDFIRLDTTPPAGTILINNNLSVTNSANVSLNLTWDDHGGAGVVRMRFSDDGKTWTAWEPLKAVKPHTLTGPDGHKTVRVQFRDGAGNVSERFSDYIRLDTTPPTGTILINNNAWRTFSPNVTLNLTWNDGAGSGVVRMRFSNDGKTWSAWTPLSANYPYLLPGPLGHNTVRTQFRDAAGNVSDRFSDYILLAE